MKRAVLLFLVLIGSRSSFAQFDTLAIDLHGTGLNVEQLIDTLSKPGVKRLVIWGGIFSPPKDCDKKCLKYYKKANALLEKRFPQVKVLYIENPTILGDGNGKSMNYDTNAVLIYTIPFQKMTALKEVNLIGNDADDIIAMPQSFYHSPAKKINCFCLNFPQSLKKSVKAKNSQVEVVVGDCIEIVTYLDTRF